MMTDIRNQKIFAAFLQRFDIQFDLLSFLDELEHQVSSLHQLLCRLHDSCGISDVYARLYSQSAANYGLYSKHSSTYNHSLIGASEQCGLIMFI